MTEEEKQTKQFLYLYSQLCTTFGMKFIAKPIITKKGTLSAELTIGMIKSKSGETDDSS